jgi:hypothetical protein
MITLRPSNRMNTTALPRCSLRGTNDCISSTCRVRRAAGVRPLRKFVMPRKRSFRLASLHVRRFRAVRLNAKVGYESPCWSAPVNC